MNRNHLTKALPSLFLVLTWVTISPDTSTPTGNAQTSLAFLFTGVYVLLVAAAGWSLLRHTTESSLRDPFTNTYVWFLTLASHLTPALMALYLWVAFERLVGPAPSTLGQPLVSLISIALGLLAGWSLTSAPSRAQLKRQNMGQAHFVTHALAAYAVAAHVLGLTVTEVSTAPRRDGCIGWLSADKDTTEMNSNSLIARLVGDVYLASTRGDASLELDSPEILDLADPLASHTGQTSAVVIDAALQRAHAIVDEHRDDIARIAAELNEHHPITLSGKAVLSLIEGVPHE